MVPPERRWTPAMHELQGYKVGCSGYEFGCYSTFWHFEKGILHEIARSSDLDYSQGLKSQNSIVFT